MGEEEMNLVTTEVEGSAAKPLQDIKPLKRTTAPQVCKCDEFVEG